MVTYFNVTSPVYRHHQQAVSSPTASTMWYAAASANNPYQNPQVPPPSYCMQEEQQWHHHQAAAAASFPHHHNHPLHADFLTGAAAVGEFHHHPAPSGAPSQSHMLHHQDPRLQSPGSDMSSPASGNLSPPNVGGRGVQGHLQQQGVMRPQPERSPYGWMKKSQSYQTQPNPEKPRFDIMGFPGGGDEFHPSYPNLTTTPSLHPSVMVTHRKKQLPACPGSSTQDGHTCGGTDDELLSKTRTKDKYRVVYTDHQRVELEKEFYYSRYITIRRKAELANNLGLSERQVKIWFQNRRAKERKQVKKRGEEFPNSASSLSNNNNNNNTSQINKQYVSNSDHVNAQLQHGGIHHSAAIIGHISHHGSTPTDSAPPIL